VTLWTDRDTNRSAERIAYPREVVEMALAHAVENKVEAAYRRAAICSRSAAS
jgi:hypothetical protein